MQMNHFTILNTKSSLRPQLTVIKGQTACYTGDMIEIAVRSYHRATPYRQNTPADIAEHNGKKARSEIKNAKMDINYFLGQYNE